MTKFTAISFCAWLALPAGAAAGEAAGQLSLPGVLAEVKAANPGLARARARLAELEAEVQAVSAYPNPSLELQQAAPGDGSFTEIKLVQPVPLTRRSGTAAAGARAAREAAAKEALALETVTLEAARKAWYAMRIAREHRRFEETNLKFSLDLLNKIGMRLQTGEAGNADLARARVEVSRSELRLSAAGTEIASAAGELNALMGRRPDAPLEMPENGGFSLTPETPEPGPLDGYTALALARRAEPQALALRGEEADLALRREKGLALPVPEIGLVRGREGGADYNRLFLGLELPLWYANKGGVGRAKARKAALAAEAAALDLQIRREVHAAWLELGLARKRLESARETVLLTNDLRRAASQDYLSGKTALASYYETNRVYLEENINYLDALESYYGRTAQLDAAVNSGEGK